MKVPHHFQRIKREVWKNMAPEASGVFNAAP